MRHLLNDDSKIFCGARIYGRGGTYYNAWHLFVLLGANYKMDRFHDGVVVCPGCRKRAKLTIKREKRADIP